MIQDMKEILDYLLNNYLGYKELCGEEDDVNTIPAREVYEKALNVYEDLQKAF